MYRSLIALAALAALAVLGFAFVAASVRAAEEKYPDISITELKAAIANKGVTVIDANGTDSFREGHIPGAIDFEATGAKLESVLPTDKAALVVAYCGGPQCMAHKAAAEKTVAMGYTNVKHLSAGISGWKAAGEKRPSHCSAGQTRPRV
jgi:rhodanese-related sulfurtransferase